MKATIINLSLLEQTSRLAIANERQRTNFNFHQPKDHAQRMLNAIEPNSYVCPHRHLSPPRAEAFLILQGKGGVLIFDETGNITQKIILDTSRGLFGVDIPGGLYHTLISFESGSVFYEVKPGPYDPNEDKGFAPWAPKEGTLEAKEYLSYLKTHFNLS